jgi:hypothetical protein
LDTLLKQVVELTHLLKEKEKEEMDVLSAGLIGLVGGVLIGKNWGKIKRRLSWLGDRLKDDFALSVDSDDYAFIDSSGCHYRGN